MKIVFNACRVGFGNNGGSRTIVKCAEALAAIGVDVVLFGPFKYTWHKPIGVKFVASGQCPCCDVVIATGYNSVPNTLAAKASKKFYYIRGLELWAAPSQKLLKSYRSLNCIVNSEWLRRFLNKKNINSDLIYPGLDFDKFHKITNVKRRRFGALWHMRHKTKRHTHALAVSQKIGINVALLNKDIKNPSEDELNRWYNKLRVWFAPTELEGLHNPPMEASLAGCALVCTDHPRSGMSDYANSDTAMIYPAGNIKLAAKMVKKLVNNKALRVRLNRNMVELLTSKIQTRESNMRKLLDLVSS